MNAFAAGIFVSFFLRIFSPFGFAAAPVENLNLFAAGYGIITIAILLLFTLIEFALPRLFEEEKWTTGKNILLYMLIVLFIGTANFFYTVIVAGLPFGLQGFLQFIFITVAVTFVVVSFLTMLKYFRSLNYFKKDALVFQEEVSKLSHNTPSVIVSLRSENDKENFSVPLDNLHYIESADNYSQIFFLSDGKMTSKLLRTSLKKLEDQLTQSELIRCHRSYIVQLRNVKRVSGNSQGYRLHFEKTQVTVPVARRMAEEVHARLRQEAVKIGQKS
jgi:hypothetical protein